MKSKSTYHIEIKNEIKKTFGVLKSLKKERKQEAFKNEFLRLLPAIKQYVKKNLEKAAKRELLKHQGYRVDDFVDDLYIYVYDHIDELDDQEDFHVWLFKAIDTLVQDALIDEEFDEFFFKDIDDYSKPEWDAMEEAFSTDGDGDLVMFEELDDTSLEKNNYELKDIFIEDNEEGLTEKLEKALSKAHINAHTQLVLDKLPLVTQNVFDLYALKGFDINEIALVKGMPVHNVNRLLEDTQNLLKSSFKNRFLS